MPETDDAVSHRQVGRTRVHAFVDFLLNKSVGWITDRRPTLTHKLNASSML
jgi:hypothetical protein